MTLSDKKLITSRVLQRAVLSLVNYNIYIVNIPVGEQYTETLTYVDGMAKIYHSRNMNSSVNYLRRANNPWKVEWRNTKIRYNPNRSQVIPFRKLTCILHIYQTVDRVEARNVQLYPFLSRNSKCFSVTRFCQTRLQIIPAKNSR